MENIPIFSRTNEELTDDANIVAMKLKEAEVLTHFFHLHTLKYAEHLALNAFYDAMNDLFDEFVEQYQGVHGIQTFNGNIEIVYMDPAIYIDGFRMFIETQIPNFSYNKSLEDVLIRISQCANKILYLLKLS